MRLLARVQNAMARGGRLACALAFCAVSSTLARTHLADGCARVYVDFGTNLGIQFRKLYEPHLFDAYAAAVDGNPSEPVFASVFGQERDDVCSFGFEASPKHTARLRDLQQAYWNTGRRVQIFTETAVSTTAQNVSFHMSSGGTGDADGIEQGGEVLVTVRAIDLADFFKKHILTRHVPVLGGTPRILMKCDAEGYDMRVMQRLLDTDVMCHIDFVYYEAAHTTPEWLKNTLAALKQKGCATKFIELDDETGAGGAWFIDPSNKYFLKAPDQ